MTSRPEGSRLSENSAAFEQLSAEQQERLSEVLDRYLSALEKGAPLAREAILAEQPDLAPALASYFRSLEELHEMAAGFGGSPDVTKPQTMDPGDEIEGAKRIGDFELIREIGRGGMGVVYEARQISLDRRVAVKLLPFAAVLDSKQIARFKHEAQAAAQIHHPNIVPVFAIGVERGVHYYAMQFIEGQALDLAIEQVKAQRGRRAKAKSPATTVSLSRISAATLADTRDDRRAPTLEATLASVAGNHREYYRTVTRLGIQAAEALNAAHEFGVVHRDIKPSNLLLEAGGKLWITDFGLARFQRDVSLTRTGDLIGTMRYMSPEQVAGQSGLVDHRSDIYSLGITLYELACLEPAFPEDRGPLLLKQIEGIDPPRPSRIRPDIPVDLETVILKAMARERDERYASAEQLAADLRCVLEGKATIARPPTLLDRAGRWVRRRQRLVAGVLAVLALTVVGLTASVALIFRANIQASSNAARAERLYGRAQEMLDKLGMQIAQDLEDVPGAEHVQQKLLEETRRYYQSLVDQMEPDEKSQLAAAVACGKIGMLLGQLGAAAEALEAHENAVSILQRLAIQQPRDAEIQRQLALAENNSGLAQMRLGSLEAARERFQQAARLQERLLSRIAGDVRVEIDLASSLSNLGLLQQQRGQSTEAEASFTTAIDRLKSITSPEKDLETKPLLAGAYNNLAGVYRAGRPAQAVALHGKAIDLLKAAAQKDAANINLRRDLAVTFDNLGAALSRSQQFRAARAAHEQAIEICEELLRIAPARISFRTDLALDYNNLGTLESREGRLDTAEVAFRRAIELYEAHIVRFPHDAAMNCRLGGVYNNLGIVLERSERLEAAASAFETAIGHQQAALAAAPQLSLVPEYLEKHRDNLARVREELARREGAAARQAGANDFPGASNPAYNDRLLWHRAEVSSLQSLTRQSP